VTTSKLFVDIAVVREAQSCVGATAAARRYAALVQEANSGLRAAIERMRAGNPWSSIRIHVSSDESELAVKLAWDLRREGYMAELGRDDVAPWIEIGLD
jgi:hypothetical protein